MIELRNIYKSFEDKKVLENVSVAFKKGKLTSLIGENAAGKSTLLGIASRLLKADRGEIYYDDMPLKAFSNKDLAKKISILKQTNHLNIRLRVKELVRFGRFPYAANHLSKLDNEKVAQATEYMGLKELENSFLDELSGGQRQRAFIAMIIAQDTEYILLDEPLNNLDMKHSVSIMKILQNLIKDFNKGVIVVLHDINFAFVYSNDIVAMKGGKIIKSGSKEELLKSEILKEIYDLDIKINEVNGKKFCYYFD